MSMEPQVQYARTSDGVNIAFASMGEGPPLVRVPQPGTAHVQRDWAMFPSIFPPLTRAFSLTWYDPRGTGLSDRDATDFSMEAMTRDLEAVIDRTGLESFAVLAFADAVPMAVTYAAKSPDRVSHLILIDGWTNWSDFIDMPSFEAHEALLDKDWTLFTETVARVLIGFDNPRLIELLGEHIRVCIEPEAYRALMVDTKIWDVSALLPDVKAQTLVLHNNSHGFYPVRAGQRLAAGIPDARFLAIDDMNYERVAPLVQEFAGTTDKPESVEPGAFRTILFPDVEGSTALTDRLGDARARELLREHESVVREALKAHGGSEVKTMGDGFMASFSSATKALECAIAMQRAFAARNESAEERIHVRIGLNAGEPIAEDDPDGRGDLFGTAVNMAARIAAKAEGAEILASNVVRELVAGKEFLFADRGDTELRG
ncbi:MAG TPA: adenylate/guanylate cyclase domain-containing protein, partial [Dehalococcoidia bacterium]